MAGPRGAGRWTLLVCLGVALVHVVVLVTLTARSGDGPHQAPVLVAAPAVVAEALANEASAFPGDPFDADWTADTDRAKEAVRDGDAVASVVVDLPGTDDVVMVNGGADPALNDALVERITSIEKSRGRSVEVRELTRPGTAGAEDDIRTYVLLCGLLGFGFVLAVSMVRGPVAGSATAGARRLLALAGVSVGGATVLQLLPAVQLPGDSVSVVAIGAGYAFTLGAITLAVEALAGLVGLAIVAATYFVLATPLLTDTSPYLLPPPWPTVTPWLMTGATQQALAGVTYLDPSHAVRPVLELAAIALVALVAVVIAWVLRRRADPATDPADMPVRHWRLWVVGSILPLAAAMALVVALVPTGATGARPVPSVASQTTCIADAAPTVSVDELNQQIATLQGSPAFRGADVGADVHLQDGRFLLVFGDTLRSSTFDGPRFVRNSMMLWDVDCVSVVLPPSKGALIPDRLDGVGYWPMSSAVIHRPGYDLVLVSTQRVATTGSGSFDFANLGPSLAVFVVPVGETPQLIGTKDFGRDDVNSARPEWGAALALDDGWLYAYGTARPADGSTLGFSLRVARVRPDDALDQSKWRYWDGSSWHADADYAVDVIPASVGVSQTLSVFHQDDRWYAVSKLGGDLGDQLAFWTAPGPTGPFTLAGPVATLPSDAASGEVTYMPLAHPDLLPVPGTMVVSYSRNNTDFSKIQADPTLYRPTLIRVPMPE